MALVLANSAYSEAILSFWKTPVGFSIGGFEMEHSLKHWINDGLMAIFFFVVGLEVKRELATGELRELRAAALPLAAAVGGMIVPAAIYLALQWNTPGHRGWGIPMATDIAFVVGCLAVLGERVPHSLRILLLSLAIADDVGAILVIAIGYSANIQLPYLVSGALAIALIGVLQRLGVRSVLVYVLVGIALWFAFHESGVHPTIAGVILGLLTPVRPWVEMNVLSGMIDEFDDFLHGGDVPEENDPQQVLRTVELAARETVSPLERLETTLHPWSSFVILPLFVAANAGVPFEASAARSPSAVAIIAGLVIGKPIGIVAFSWIAIALRLARLPEGLSWSVLAAGSVLAGIGFTMSIFIAGLAFDGELLDAAKVGILTASAISGLAGMLLLYWCLPKPYRSTGR
jgi:NhaA family Na+:H+ antiporter